MSCCIHEITAQQQISAKSFQCRNRVASLEVGPEFFQNTTDFQRTEISSLTETATYEFTSPPPKLHPSQAVPQNLWLATLCGNYLKWQQHDCHITWQTISVQCLFLQLNCLQEIQLYTIFTICNDNSVAGTGG